jgi:hypothetical protein
MSTHTEPVSCPNCHVSAQTEVALRLLNNDEDGHSDSVYCKLCDYQSLTPESTDRYYESRDNDGQVVPIEEVPARARALMAEDGYTDEDIDENVESWVDPVWLKSDDYKSRKVEVEQVRYYTIAEAMAEMTLEEVATMDEVRDALLEQHGLT